MELELRAAWQDLARTEAAHHARLEAAEAAVRETSRSAQARLQSPAPLCVPNCTCRCIAGELHFLNRPKAGIENPGTRYGLTFRSGDDAFPEDLSQWPLVFPPTCPAPTGVPPTGGELMFELRRAVHGLGISPEAGSRTQLLLRCFGLYGSGLKA